MMLVPPYTSPALTRRAFVGGATALLAAPSAIARTVPGPSDPISDHAAELPQLHALVLNRGGETVYAEAFRGPGLERPANIKSVSKTIHALLAGIAIDRGILAGPDQLVLPLLGRTPYGYGWFLTRFAGRAAAYGRGYGGQLLVVVPGLDVSIAITSDPTRPARSGGYFTQLRALIERSISHVETT